MSDSQATGRPLCVNKLRSCCHIGITRRMVWQAGTIQTVGNLPHASLSPLSAKGLRCGQARYTQWYTFCLPSVKLDRGCYPDRRGCQEVGGMLATKGSRPY